MPTLPLKATKLPAATASREESMARALEMAPNTCPFDVTGHPAVSVPCGMSEGLPVGMMLVGRRGEDVTVLRAATPFSARSLQLRRPRARSVLRVAARHAHPTTTRRTAVQARRNPNLAAVALANKQARIVWALLAHDREYTPDYAVTSP